MSDQKSSFGEPVDEPKDVDHDVVGRAHEGLADAEAARADATGPTDSHSSAESDEPATPREHDAPADPTPPVERDTPADPSQNVPAERPLATEPAAPSASEPRSAAAGGAEPAAAASTPWYERQDEDEARWAAYAASADTPDSTPTAATPEPTPTTATPAADDTPTVVAAPAAARSEPANAENPAVFPAGQPIFVQAPEAPRPRGNRGTAGAIGLLAAVAFAVLYLAATLGFGLLYGDIAVDGLLEATLATLATASLWVPVAVFFIAFWLLGAIINRGRWGHWVVWGLLVGIAAWLGHILGVLFQEPFWRLTAREGAALIEEQILAPLAIVAFVLGRELTIWFGAWVAARGKRVTELNDEAQREYERTLEAGPQLHRG